MLSSIRILIVHICALLLVVFILFIVKDYSMQSVLRTYILITIPIAIIDIVAAMILAIVNYKKNKAGILGLFLSGTFLLLTGFFIFTFVGFDTKLT